MDSTQGARLITAAGGDIAFAKLLGLDETEGLQQRINNWKRRGIPSRVIVEHYEKLKYLERLADETAPRDPHRGNRGEAPDR